MDDVVALPDVGKDLDRLSALLRSLRLSVLLGGENIAVPKENKLFLWIFQAGGQDCPGPA